MLPANWKWDGNEMTRKLRHPSYAERLSIAQFLPCHEAKLAQRRKDSGYRNNVRQYIELEYHSMRLVVALNWAVRRNRLNPSLKVKK